MPRTLIVCEEEEEEGGGPSEDESTIRVILGTLATSQARLRAPPLACIPPTRHSLVLRNGPECQASRHQLSRPMHPPQRSLLNVSPAFQASPPPSRHPFPSNTQQRVPQPRPQLLLSSHSLLHHPLSRFRARYLHHNAPPQLPLRQPLAPPSTNPTPPALSSPPKAHRTPPQPPLHQPSAQPSTSLNPRHALCNIRCNSHVSPGCLRPSATHWQLSLRQPELRQPERQQPERQQPETQQPETRQFERPQ
jgi:hypothetical protein